MRLFLVILLVLAVVFGLWTYLFQEDSAIEEVVLSHKDATYIVEGRSIRLEDGFSDVEDMAGSGVRITTRYFGNELKYDLNGDGREDVAFLLTQETGGSGTFFYLVAALNTPGGYVGSQALFLGDRIAPQTTHVDEESASGAVSDRKLIVVNFAERLPGEPFTARPSLGKSVWVNFEPTTMQFKEVTKSR